ncbi:Protein kinase domain-containing protein [Mycena venus]|uniref:Protein kinase domain-containing protein n=1 Tax=Mycena venus TaxID=2733690 RepID=A0A8H6U4U7_9AGAR|nr:Protein kinase domain-containing protein [Mycena venus]
MLRAKDYEERFAQFIITFNNHQRSLILVLAEYTAIRVGTANLKLDKQGEDITVIKVRIESLFRMLDSAREREVQRLITDKGGAKACVESDAILLELAEKSGESIDSLVGRRSAKGDVTSKQMMEEARRILNKELGQNIDEAFTKHKDDFDRKLNAVRIQQTQLSVEIASTGEHVINALSGELDSKIKDLEPRKLWKQRSWKGSVYARDFVLGLKEHFASELDHDTSGRTKLTVENVASLGEHPAVEPPSPSSSVGDYHAAEKHEGDQWALAVINADHFARLRPASWSLLHWFAFWAAGWHLTVTWYRHRIYNILIAMLRLVHRVKPANVQAANTYFAGRGIQRVELLLRATRPVESGYTYQEETQLKNLAREYHKLEEGNLKSQLEELRYKLDNIDTLQLVTGTQSSGLRRIEVHVYPLLYQMLLRHLAILQLACVHNLHDDEFPMMNTSLATIFGAVDHRTNKLGGMFKSNATDAKEGFSYFAFGMFQELYTSAHERDPINNTIYNQREEEDDGLDDNANLGLNPEDDETTAIESFASIDRRILLNTIADGPIRLHSPETPQSPPVVLSGSDPLDGMWTGHIFFPDKKSLHGKFSMQLTRSGAEVTGVAENVSGLLNVTGTAEGKRLVRFTITWPKEFGYRVECTVTGSYAPWTDMITGLWRAKTVDPITGLWLEQSDSIDDPPRARESPRASCSAALRNSMASTGGKRYLVRGWKVVIEATMDMVRAERPHTKLPWLHQVRAHDNLVWLVDCLLERRRFITLTKREIADWQNLSTPWKSLDEAGDAEL